MRILPSCNTKVFAVAAVGPRRGRSTTARLRLVVDTLVWRADDRWCEPARPLLPSVERGDPYAQRGSAFQPEVGNHSATGGEICQKLKE